MPIVYHADAELSPATGRSAARHVAPEARSYSGTAPANRVSSGRKPSMILLNGTAPQPGVKQSRLSRARFSKKVQ